jgi:ribose transport system ATP-binding protein
VRGIPRTPVPTRLWTPLREKAGEEAVTGYRLEMKGIAKEFPGVRALQGVDFAVKPGEVHALLGVNGAGKSTLIKILSGTFGKDAGTILLDDRPIEINSPQDAMDHGIATVYQEPQVLPSFTGYEYIFLGNESEGKGTFSVIHRKQLRERAQRILELFPADIDLTRPVGQLGAVDQEILAILRALSRKMSVLVLDEPTSILTETEKHVLFRLIAALKQRGISIIYISHRLEEVRQVVDRLTIIRDGKNVATLDARDQATNPMRIAELMLGEKIESIYPAKGDDIGEEVLAANGLSLEGKFQEVTFSARKGQILGIFGLVGSGVQELAKTLFGLFKPTRGTLRLHGKGIELRSAHDAIKRGIFLVPADRRREGLIALEPMFFNVSLANLGEVSAFAGLIRGRREKKRVSALIDKVGVTPPDVHAKVSALSGGNQQKVIVSKGLFTEAEVYIFLEPTAGVDVGAKSGIYRLIRELSRTAAVILISSDCEEVYGVGDRIITLFRGRVTGDTDVEKVSLQEMLLLGVQGRI